jgi:hypothetical protein
MRRKQFFRALEILEEREDGSIVVTMETANEMDFFQRIARWVPYVSVTGPPQYRNL